MVRVSVLLLLGLLAACSFEVQPEPQGDWNEWVCASEVKVYWRADGSDGQKIQLRVGAGNMLHILTRNPDDSAVRYSDNQLVFERQGNQALVYSVYGHDIIGRNCKAQAE